MKDRIINDSSIKNINFENIIYNEYHKEDRKCILCNRPYDYKYIMFGRTCLENLYKQLKVGKIGSFFNKENHLLNSISHRNLKFFLSKSKKQAVLENYIELDYIKRMNLKSMDSIREQIERNINRISAFSELKEDMFPNYSVNSFYKVYQDYQKFKNETEKISHIKNNDDKYNEAILNGLSFVFDTGKLAYPIQYFAFYGMQYEF